MKLDPRYYPVVILAVFIFFILLGLLLGFWPGRGGEGRHGVLLVVSAIA